MNVSEIVKPSNLDDFLQMQLSCLGDDLHKLCFLSRFELAQPHLPDGPIIELMALYEIAQTPAQEISFLVTDQGASLLQAFEQNQSGVDIAQQLGVAWVSLKSGLPLEPVYVPKPWGREIWYSGIERRGVSRVATRTGSSPLDWVVGAAPRRVLGQDRTPVLLKVLDPLPDEVYGDLYFEMHEKKQEVYVVTHVDSQAWPGGVGGIRFGFDPSLRKQYASDDLFRKAYLQAVQQYRQIRQRIDERIDQCRQTANIALDAPVAPAQLQAWQATLPKELLEQEKALRQRMENFMAIRPLSVGDVVRVPCYVPHSLQHGVRTIEFQTPVYERKILSFAQKVLTQPDWDTEQAIDQILLDTPGQDPLEVLESNGHCVRQRVVSFDTFQVERVELKANGRLSLDSGRYRLLFVVSGDVRLDEVVILPEQVRLFPASVDVRLCAGEHGALLLLAEPLDKQVPDVPSA